MAKTDLNENRSPLGGVNIVDFQVRGLTRHFGGLCAVDHVSFEISSNKLIGLIGPNGSGKTTLINLISGILSPHEGEIILESTNLVELEPWDIAASGIGRTYQIPRIFNRMSVLENLMVPGTALSTSEGSFSRAMELLEFLQLTHLRDEFGKNLSGGQKKLLEIGRTVMLNPDIILLDESFAGVHPKLRKQIHEFIKEQQKTGKAFIIVSHDLNTVFSLSQRILVLNSGQLIFDGTPDEVRKNGEVKQAYLGDIDAGD